MMEQNLETSLTWQECLELLQTTESAGDEIEVTTKGHSFTLFRKKKCFDRFWEYQGAFEKIGMDGMLIPQPWGTEIRTYNAFPVINKILAATPIFVFFIFAAMAATMLIFQIGTGLAQFTLIMTACAMPLAIASSIMRIRHISSLEKQEASSLLDFLQDRLRARPLRYEHSIAAAPILDESRGSI